MNTTKRLLALVLCVLMAISSLSSFAFAADIYSEESATSDAKGSAAALGNIDPLADNVFVFDSSMGRTDTTYDLTWLGQSYPSLKAYKSSDYEGSKVFRTIANFETFLGKVDIDNPIVLVKGCGSSISVKISATYITEAYDVVPFVRGTARNGSDWVYNTEFDEKALAVDSLELAKAAVGDFAFYGFKIAEEVNDAKRTPGNANITVGNCVFESEGSAGAPIFNLSNAINKKDNADTLTITNFFVKAATNSKAVPTLFNGNLPAHVVIDGLYIPSSVDIAGAKNELIQVENVSSFTIKNSNLQGVKMSAFEFVGAKAAITAGQSKAIVFENNIINGIGDSTAVVNFISTNYTSLRFNNNTLINTSAVELANAIGAEASADGMAALELEVKNNWFNALKNVIKITTGADSANLRNILATIEKNFTNTIYSEDEAAMIGVSLDAKDHGFSANSYYTDAAMTALVDMSLQIIETTADNGEVFFSNAARSIYYIMGSGDATSLKVKFAKDGSTYKIYADMKCTEEVSLADIKYDDTTAYYYFRSTTADGSFSSDPYKMTIVRDVASQPYFSKEFSDPEGIIGKDALVADVDSGYVADGRLYVGTWAGETYTFIKGYDVFESVDAAAAYARANGIENPQFMLKDLNGDKKSNATWQVLNPGRYYTEAYATSPVKKGVAADGSDWAFNEEYTNAGPIEIAKIWMPVNGTAGEYEFHGFTFGQYVDKTQRHYEAKVLINNCFMNVTSWSHTNYFFHFDEAKAMSTTEKNFADSLVVKDTFIETNGGSGRYISGTIPAHFVWDGIFLNATAGCFSGQVYCQQFSNFAEYTIRNSLLKNFSTDSYNAYLEGTWDKQCAAGTDRKLIFDNNIFYHSYFSKDGIISGFIGAYTEFQFTNNNFYATTPKSVFKDFKGWAGASAMKVTVTNNILNCINTEFDLNGRTIDAANSVIADNYATTTHKIGEVTYGGTNMTSSVITCGMGWVDSEMKYRPNKILPYSFTGKNVIVNNTASTITYIVAGEEDPCFTETIRYKKDDPTAINYVRYVLDFGSIIVNDYENIVTLSYNDKTLPITDKLQFDVNDVRLEKPINATISVSSMDGTATPQTYTLVIVDNGPVINSVTVGEQEAVYENGKYYVTLPARDANEEIVATALVEGTEISLDSDTVVAAPGETVEYKINAELAGLKNTVTLVVVRELADYAELNAALEAADASNSSAWLPVYKKQLDNYIAAADALDRATTEQADVDALTAQINEILANYVERTAIDAKILEVKRIRNNAGKYCDVTYDALQQTALDIEDSIPSLSSQDDVDAAITILENAKAALKEHKFSTYVHDAGTENCKENGTMTAKCNTPGCSMTDTKAETGKYTNEDHAYGEYTYNNDATLEADGTKTAICSRCNKATTVTAEGTKLTVLNSTTLFTDVKADAWYKEYVDYVATFGILNGVGNKEFGVSVDMTRAQFVQVLANLAGVDTKNNDVDTKFTDVEKGKWYTAAVKWAADNGVVSGTSATTFAPNAAVDRQQLCVMLVNFAKKFNVTINKKVDKTVFPDDAKIADWAKEAVYTCQQAGVVKGNEKGYFQPTKTATRPEVAVIITVVHQDYLA